MSVSSISSAIWHVLKPQASSTTALRYNKLVDSEEHTKNILLTFLLWNGSKPAATLEPAMSDVQSRISTVSVPSSFWAVWIARAVISRWWATSIVGMGAPYWAVRRRTWLCNERRAEMSLSIQSSWVAHEASLIPPSRENPSTPLKSSRIIRSE